MEKRLYDTLRQSGKDQLHLSFSTPFSKAKNPTPKKTLNSPFQIDFLTHKIVNIG
ncbi:MAG: hypothetical protein KDK71_03775 [Chlamydiia bacterium]|nr:hypothetical protein [Chlamydiia bacterium]